MPKTNTCSRILTPKQVGPICWFMATFVAMFYSQRSRKLLLEASNTWDKKKELFTLLKHVLDDKYLKTASRESEDYRNFSDDTFFNILSLLHEENKVAFPFNPKQILGSFQPQLYIGKLYNLLNVDYKMFDYSMSQFVLRYSYLNKDYDDFRIFKIEDKTVIDNIEDKEDRLKGYKYVDDNYAPPILLLRVYTYHIPIYDSILADNMIPEGSKNGSIRYRKPHIMYNDKEYTLDSVILTNSNTEHSIGHIIAGITCKKQKYVYNGWPRIYMDPAKAPSDITQHIPCELMKYNWNAFYDRDLCINRKMCMLDNLITQAPKGDFCFNFSTGVRILQYVRNDAKSATSSSRIEAKSRTTDVLPVLPKRRGRAAATAPAPTATPVAKAPKAPKVAKAPKVPRAPKSPKAPKSPSKSPKSPSKSPVLPKRKGRPRKKSPLVSTVVTRVSPSPPAARTSPVSPSPPAARTSPVINKSPTTDVPAIQPRRSERLRKKAEDAKNKL
jgi:hypothetical protein